MIYELSPLHDHHGELLSVVRLISVDHCAYQTRIGERTVGDGPSELFNSITTVIIINDKVEAFHAYL